MKVAVIGKNGMEAKYLSMCIPENTTEIIVNSTNGIGKFAKKYAVFHNLKFTEFLPDYKKHGKYAKVQRNNLLIDYSDAVIICSKRISKDIKYIIERCKAEYKPINFIICCKTIKQNSI